MKNQLKSAITLTTAFILGIVALNAKSEPCKRIEKVTQWMQDSLGLNASQIQKIKTLNDAACVKLKEIKTNSTGDEVAEKEKVKEVIKTLKKDYAAVLTPKQIEKLKAHRKQNYGRGENLSPEQKAEHITKKMKEILSLTGVQVPKVYSANLEFVNQMGAIIDETGDEASKKVKRKEAHKQHKAALKEIFTDDQEAILKEKKKEKKENSNKK